MKILLSSFNYCQCNFFRSLETASNSTPFDARNGIKNTIIIQVSGRTLTGLVIVKYSFFQHFILRFKFFCFVNCRKLTRLQTQMTRHVFLVVFSFQYKVYYLLNVSIFRHDQHNLTSERVKGCNVCVEMDKRNLLGLFLWCFINQGTQDGSPRWFVMGKVKAL